MNQIMNQIERKTRINDDPFVKETIFEFRTKKPEAFNIKTTTATKIVKDISNDIKKQSKGNKKPYYTFVRIHEEKGTYTFKVENGVMVGFDEEYYRNSQNGAGSGIGKIEIFVQVLNN